MAFLTGIGIPVREAPVPASSFLPGVRIENGALVFDRLALRWPGDLLHEAGHVAVTPSAFRHALSDGVDLPEAVPHASEIEATAWAYAALHHLKLEPAVLFHEGGYRGHSPALINTFTLGVYPGSFGLAQAGMTFVGAQAKESGRPVYPTMSRWLRE